jgi:hypothetical protein
MEFGVRAVSVSVGSFLCAWPLVCSSQASYYKQGFLMPKKNQPSIISKSNITAEYLRTILEYNPDTGIFLWRWRDDVSKQVNSRDAGTVAGHVRKDLYVQILINRQACLAHRLAWLFVYGEWPPDQIDHIDGKKGNNRIKNLRLATNQENKRNSGLQKNNSTGFTGVLWRKRDRKFMAQIVVGGKYIYLGNHKTIAEAIAARREAEIEYFGEFRRVA